MAYENITLRKQNVVMVDGYFYMIDEELDSLIVKTDDGTQAFSYPLDTTIGPEEVVSLEYDGRNFWTLENLAGSNIRIRKWYIDNYVLKLRDSKTYSETGSSKYESNAFTVEHYHRTFSSPETIGQTTLSINDSSGLSLGMTITLGPSSSVDAPSNGKIEEVTVQSAAPGSVDVSPGISYNFESGDPICFTTNIWIFNDWNGIVAGGALYKYDATTWASEVIYPGGAYDGVEAATFYDITGYITDASDSICYIKGTNMIFLDPTDITTSFGSMVMDNVEDDNATVIPIYDVTIYGDNVYRLQDRATYYGTTEGPWTNFSYQLSTLNTFVTSISLSADPAILPADAGISSSLITAIVKDQFLEPIASKQVYFTHDDATGVITGSPASTDGNGIATVLYYSGNTANEVRITATVQQ